MDGKDFRDLKVWQLGMHRRGLAVRELGMHERGQQSENAD